MYELWQVRPPVAHRFGCGPLKAGEAPPTARVFKHRLLQHFMLSLFCKLPVQPMTRIRDMRAAFMVRPRSQLHGVFAGCSHAWQIFRIMPPLNSLQRQAYDPRWQCLLESKLSVCLDERLVQQTLAFVQVRIMLSVLQFRLNRRYVEAQPPFIAIELDQSDSGREGCAVSTLTITSEPKDWRGAIQVPRALLTLAHIPCYSNLWQLTEQLQELALHI